MSNCYAGKSGALSIDGTNVAMLTNWSLTQSAEILDCTSMGGNGYKDHKTGLLMWEGSCEANFADTTADAANANNLTTTELVAGTEVALIFYPDYAAKPGVTFSGSALVTSIENGASLGDVQTVSVSFTGNGALTTDLVP